MIKFEWDEFKAAANLKKHQVSFEEAKSIFFDDFGVQFFDGDHSDDEERFLMLGTSIEAKLLIVCHCERKRGAVIRIISTAKQPSAKARFIEVHTHESRARPFQTEVSQEPLCIQAEEASHDAAVRRCGGVFQGHG